MSPRTRAWGTQAIAYLFALALAALAIRATPLEDPFWLAAIGDVVATLVIFRFSVANDNSSLYDPYWSLAPPVLFAYWALDGGAVPTRALIVAGLVAFWAARLTGNFLRGFHELSHEDWRYVDLREQHGKRYWLVSFVGVHFFPTVLTFAGSVSLYVVLGSDAPLGPLDGVAAAVTALGIAYETIADEQLRAYVRSRPPKGEWLRTSLWKHTRHPNYFGEVTFWWGLYLFSVAAAPEAWWAAIGPAGITLLFFFVSIPLIDARMVRRRPGYADYAKRVSRLVPWLVGR